MLILSQRRIPQNVGQKFKPIVLIAVALAFSASLIMGCGKKAPPVAPYFIPLPAVQSLEYEIIDEKTLKLSWQIPMKNGLIFPELEGIKVYRSKLSLADCQNCPLRFELMEDMAAVSDAKKKYLMQYFEILDMGYNYVYKIRTYGRGAISKDSGEISFNF